MASNAQPTILSRPDRIQSKRPAHLSQLLPPRSQNTTPEKARQKSVRRDGACPVSLCARSRAKPREIWSKARFWPGLVNFETMNFATCCRDQLLFAII